MNRSITEILKAAGGPVAIAERSEGALTVDAVYKWQRNGIPDRHWPLVMPHAGATPEEMFSANELLRDQAGAA